MLLPIAKATKWTSRKKAISSLTDFCRSEQFAAGFETAQASDILLLVKTNTKSFKEANFNIVRAIMEMIVALCEVHAAKSSTFPEWACSDSVLLATDKISDKKLNASSQQLLTEMLVVSHTRDVLPPCFTRLDGIKSPVAHESFLVWLKTAIMDFGASLLSPIIKDTVSFLVKVSTQHLNVCYSVANQLAALRNVGARM